MANFIAIYLKFILTWQNNVEEI